jgi:hypothetical protein
MQRIHSYYAAKAQKLTAMIQPAVVYDDFDAEQMASGQHRKVCVNLSR